MIENKKYWKGIAQLNDDPVVKKLEENEFVDKLPIDKLFEENDLSTGNTSRRDFLKFLGFTTAAASLAACEAPINKVIPYVNKPEEIVPGVANYYASTIYDGHDFASVLVKTREGRPIKIESNNTCANARVQSSVLSLYDSSRLRNPMISKVESNWGSVDKDIVKKLGEIKENGGKIAILTSTIISPTIYNLIDNFKTKYGNVVHVQKDSVSSDGILDANLEYFGIRRVPTYNFEKSEVIVSFGADFLGNFPGNTDYAKQYVEGRNPKNKKMSKHYQVESNLTLTGSNADHRVQIKPSEQAGLLSQLYRYITKKSTTIDSRIYKIGKSLLESNSSIVLCNSNDKEVQLIVNAINDYLKNYDRTISIKNHTNLKQGNDQDLQNLIYEMQAGQIDALITYNINPSYILPDSDNFNKAMSNVGLTISTSKYMDETSINMDYVCPDSHNLESWGDFVPYNGVCTLMQPTINPLFNTRQFQDSLLKWSQNDISYNDYLKDTYKNDWENKLHDGYFDVELEKISLKQVKNKDLLIKNFPIKQNSNNIEFCISEKISLGDGSQANNPWLQELPDPLSRATWDNYLTISEITAKELDLRNWNVSNGALNGDIVDLTLGDVTINNVPVMIQPGQAIGTVSMAIGYGRTNAGKCGNGIGLNVYPLVNGGEVVIEKVEGIHEFAATQLHHTMMGRNIVKETTLDEYIKNPASGNDHDKFLTHEGKKRANEVSLWNKHDHETGHHWNLSIDLTACIGCASCVISCHAENNVPVVGKEEIRKSRDMHWLRIDRYFSSDMTKEVAKDQNASAIDMYSKMEDPSVNPEVVFQPVMCMHCNNAPCETVCPVAATTHSAEGLNHMTYNRCVGTRYCLNNCPYKVRRFNWFQYSDNDAFDFNMNDDYGKMVLNPDVVVRSRGVMEKCTMCLHKIQEFKLTAKREGRKIKDEEAQTACASACETNALVFGDVNDKNHTVHKLRKDERSYDLLDHLNVAPSVFYQTKIRNKS